MGPWYWLINRISLLFFLIFPGWIFCQNPREAFKEFKINYTKSLNRQIWDTSQYETRFYTWKKRYLIKAILIPQDTPQVVQLIQTDQSVKEYLVFGQIAFNLHGKDYSLSAFKELRHVRNPLLKSLVFVPFNDQTNGQSTYAGGRYLQIRHTKEQLVIWLDFNYATNPLCVYQDTSCPLVPLSNKIKGVIRAGEKKPRIK